MPNLTHDGLRVVAEIASRHGVSLEAAFALLDSLALSNGTQAQFNHADLGGMGQWGGGNMIMIGDMFNHGLKDRVAKLCQIISDHLEDFSESVANRGAGRVGWEPQRDGGTERRRDRETEGRTVPPFHFVLSFFRDPSELFAASPGHVCLRAGSIDYRSDALFP